MTFFVVLYKYDLEVRSLYFSSLPVWVCLRVWFLFAQACGPAYVLLCLPVWGVYVDMCLGSFRRLLPRGQCVGEENMLYLSEAPHNFFNLPASHASSPFLDTTDTTPYVKLKMTS